MIKNVSILKNALPELMIPQNIKTQRKSSTKDSPKPKERGIVPI